PESPDPPQKPPDSGPLSVVDTFLSAPDILPRHCLVQWGGGDAAFGAGGDPRQATVRPFRGAPTTLNGTPLLRRAPLNPGDLLGLGEHVLLLYKDPRLGEGSRPAWLPPPREAPGVLGVLGCAGCGRSPRQRREELRGALETPKAELRYRPQDEGTLLREILSLDLGGGPAAPEEGGEGSPGGQGDGGQEDLGALAPAFLLGLCLEHAAAEFPAGHLPELLGKVAAMLRETVWVSLGTFRGAGPCPELEQDLESCDEALGVLDEVIMSTFQQSVYYLTKVGGQNTPKTPKNNPGRAVAGGAGPQFQWWAGVRLRTNLDLLLDGLGALGLAAIAGDFFRKLSATANLLSTPRGCLRQATWARLRAEFPALSPAQLHHVLRHYRLGGGQPAPPAWSPGPEESAAATSGDIFESFSEHPPLLLPTRGFRLRLGVPLGPGGLLRPLLKIRRRLWELEGGEDL
ncbi:ras-interacting protein 1-like, partial [Onychostruthus taczanowskii]|uniref:ras-interacting protein 1-like n=1 Tax=Onychostruthus taczanowskii TaxID=356909 RepID=UPI001B802CB7